jgi:hypothetical protein
MQFTEESLFATIGRQAMAIDHLNHQVAELRAQLHESIRAKASIDNHNGAAPAPGNGHVTSHG